MNHTNFAIRTVSLLIILTAIDVLNADGEDPAYYDQAVAVIDEMLKAQSSEVDTVSGATFSSTGLIEATADALGKAEK